MIDGVGLHAFDEAEVIGDGGGVGHEGTDPGATLAVVFEGFDGSEEEFIFGVAHRGKAFSGDVLCGEGLTVHRLEFGFPVEEIHVGGAPVHEEVDDAFGLWRVVREAGEAAESFGMSRGGEAVVGEQLGESGGSDSRG